MLVTAKDINAAFNLARDIRVNYDSEWQQISDEGLGRRDFTTERTPGRSRTVDILDTTMRQSQIMLAGGLQGLLANPETAWFDVRPEDQKLLEQPEVVSWYEHVTKVTLRSFQRPQAQWASMFSEQLFDITGFGTGVLMTLEDIVEGAYYLARPLGEIYLKEDERGRVDTVFRRFKYTARQCSLAFAINEQGHTRSEDVNKALLEKPEKEFEILHLVHKSTDPTSGVPIERIGKPWRSVYMTLQGKKEFLSESGFFELPYHVARWSKEAGEVYGRGPGWVTLPDGKTLNAMMRSIMKMGQKAVEPPLLVPDDGVMTQLRSAPNSLNVVRADMLIRARGSIIQPLPTGTLFPITQELLEEKRNAVREAFFATLLQLFKDPRMTATQVLEISAEAQRLMAPMLSRIKGELLDPAVNRTFRINWRRGAYRPPPPSLLGSPIKIEYTSPVLRASRQPEGQAVLGVWSAAGNMGQIDPTVFDNLSADNSIRIIHEALGAPASVMRTPQAVEALRQAQAQQAQQQAALAQAEQMAKIAKDTGGSLDPTGGPQAAPRIAA